MSDVNISTELDADGILLARIDMPGRAMNVFSRDLMDSLEALVVRAEQDDDVRAVVLTSGKSSFLAGADLDMIRVFTERARTDTPQQLHELCGHLGRLFRRLELCPKPFVAAINGLALGGGLEVAMACHARVVADSAEAQLGLPEVKLGLLPGAGGTQRLPRLVGAEKGLQMLLTGAPVSPAEALSIGLVQEVATPDQLIDAAKRRAREMPAPGAPWDRADATFDQAPFDFSEKDAGEAVEAHYALKPDQLAHYPAYRAIIDCVVGGWNLEMTEGGHREMDIFVHLIRDPVAGNMVRALFLNRQKAAKQGLLKPDSPLASGGNALLPRLRIAGTQALESGCDDNEILLAGAFAAIRCWADGNVDQPELADVAAVAAGLYPAYTGGPFNYVLQHGLDALTSRARTAAGRNPSLFEIPVQLEDFASHAEPVA